MNTSSQPNAPLICPTCSSVIPADAPQGLCPKCLLLGVASVSDTPPPSSPTASRRPLSPDRDSFRRRDIEGADSKNGRPAPPSIEELAIAFPQLEIIELIGRGGMGFVYKARQPKLDRLVALKILPGHLANQPSFRERFEREARVLAKLQHQQIVAVYDFGEAISVAADQPRGIAPANHEPLVSPEGVQAFEASSLSSANSSTTPKSHCPSYFYLLLEFVDGVNLRDAMRAGRFSPE